MSLSVANGNDNIQMRESRTNELNHGRESLAEQGRDKSPNKALLE